MQVMVCKFLCINNNIRLMPCQYLEEKCFAAVQDLENIKVHQEVWCRGESTNLFPSLKEEIQSACNLSHF